MTGKNSEAPDEATATTASIAVYSALTAAKAGKPLPDGSALFAEVYSAKLDANNSPITGSDGF